MTDIKRRLPSFAEAENDAEYGSAQKTNDGEAMLLAVGDISLKAHRNADPFAGIASTLSSGDILFGNLETTLFDGKCTAHKAVQITAPSWKVKYLKRAGFNVLNLSNNHILDCGIEGLTGTLEVLRQEGLNCIGVRTNKYNCRQTIINKNGISFGFLGYGNKSFSNKKSNTIINNITAKDILSDIRAISPNCDFTIVSLHWGIENVYYPSPSQIKMARSFIDAGANIILGHHPHVIQGIEEYKGGLIAYSLGNFQFQYDVSQNAPTADCQTDRSIILSLRIGKEGLISHEVIPVALDRTYSPILPDVAVKNSIMNLMNQISRPLSVNKISGQRWFDCIAERYLGDFMRSWKIRIRRYGLLHFLGLCLWLVTPFVLRCYFSMIKKLFIGQRPNSTPGIRKEISNIDADNISIYPNANTSDKYLESIST
jgi:poly-gamma-glutamate capsule biosynthesis protein CapA/YwtB (metallophosphatase superfamily)